VVRSDQGHAFLLPAIRSPARLGPADIVHTFTPPHREPAMILQRPRKEDFVLQQDIKVDTENRGFTDAEMQALAGARPSEGARGLGDRWWAQIWGRQRQVPPQIQNLKSEFGYQSNPLLTNLVAVADSQGTPLDAVIKGRAANSNFYIMRCGVFIAPNGGEKFEALKFTVRYKADTASTYAMLPGPQDKKQLELGGKADVGLNGKLQFGLPEISVAAATADASAKADLEAKFIVAFHYELKTPVVDAYGLGSPFCTWLMHKGDNLRNDVVFYPIIMTPKSVTAFECEFEAYFKIGHPDWSNSEFFLQPSRTIRVAA
jgi:hypothetical protein